MTGLDLRPRVILHTSGGAAIILIDPQSALRGTVTFPMLGQVPYDVIPDFPVSQVVLHVPVYGDVALPVDVTTLGGGGASVVDLPVLGPTPYEVVLGPPEIPPEQMLTASGAASAMLGGGVGLIIGTALIAFFAYKWSQR